MPGLIRAPDAVAILVSFVLEEEQSQLTVNGNIIIIQVSRTQCPLYILQHLKKYISHIEIYIEKVFKLKIRIVIK